MSNISRLEYAGVWSQTAAITSLVFSSSSGANLAASSILTLYGVN